MRRELVKPGRTEELFVGEASSEVTQLDDLIRRTLVTSVDRVEPPSEVRDRIVQRCASRRSPDHRAGVDDERRRAPPQARSGRVVIGALLSALNILIEVLQVDAVCHSAAPLNSLAVLYNLRSI